jgi:hypothetical protein
MNACVKRRNPEGQYERRTLEFEPAILYSVYFRYKEQSMVTDYRALRESGARVTDSPIPILLANDPTDEDSDDEIDSFERIVDVRAALLNVLECV